MPDFVIVLDRNGMIQFINRTYPEYTMEEVVGTSSFDFFAPEDIPQFRQALQRCLETGKVQPTECRDLGGHYYDCRIVPMDSGRAADNAMVIAAEVTELKQAEQAIRKERALLRQLLELHERDRKLTAYEIHDGIAQYLTAALLNLEGSEQLWQTEREKAKEHFRTGCRLLGRGIAEARRLISGLRPPVLDESGIVVAISFLIHEHQHDGHPQIEFIRDVEFERLAPPLESALFRIAQESLANACRHARTDKIRIELVQTDHHVRLKVRDWGIGFSESEVKEEQFGLRGIRERARLLGGRVEIETAANRGTTIDVELPLIEPAPKG